jgi:hypothetical protein
MEKMAEYLLETADRCIQLARAGQEISEKLQALGSELMAKAVELDTTLQKKRQRKSQPIDPRD